jgi:hypothetical protein
MARGERSVRRADGKMAEANSNSRSYPFRRALIPFRGKDAEPWRTKNLATILTRPLEQRR